MGRPYSYPGLSFVELPLVERAAIIAQYRTRNSIDSAIAQKASKQK